MHRREQILTAAALPAAAAAALVAAFASSASAAPMNLAPNGTATASSEGFGTVAADGNDANRDGAYGNGSVFHTLDPDTAAFWQVDLGDSFYLDRVQIFPRTDARQGTVENFRVTVFEDAGGSPGNAVFTQDYLPNDRADFTWGATLPGTTLGRFVRMDKLDPAPSFLTFAEFEVYGQNTPVGDNVALNKPVTASAPGFGTDAEAGVDGDIDGDFFNTGFPVYHSESAGVGQFYQVDLGGTVPLDYIQLFDRSDAETTSQFEVSVLDENQVEVFSTIVDSAGPVAYDHTLDLTDVSGRFLRVETTLNEFLAFAEIRAVAVPEPGALGLLAAAGGAALIRRRRRGA